MALADHDLPVTGLFEQYQRLGLGERSDQALAAAIAGVLATPRQEPADSFILHAPLELTARVALLPFVAPDQRELARVRLLSLAAGYRSFGPPVAEPDEPAFADASLAAVALADAVRHGDLDRVDIAARQLGRVARADEMRTLLSDEMVGRLSAAAHAPIFLFHLPRSAPRGELTGELLRGLARDLARQPDWRLAWTEEPAGRSEGSPEALLAALSHAPPPQSADRSFFIYPMMSTVDQSGLAAELLGPVTGGTDIAERGRVVLRAAALSMLHEPDDHAPYGWSHCLTLPQAVLGIAGSVADRSRALAVAATYVLGCRTAMATGSLPAGYDPDGPGVPWREALDAGPKAAAAAVFHAPPADEGDVMTELATRASIQHDAHLVKYTLACFDAAADDPGHRRLFLAAAASLVAWWEQVDNPDDRLRDG